MLSTMHTTQHTPTAYQSLWKTSVS